MRELDPNEVYDRALSRGGQAGLDEDERVIYVLKEFEVFIQMEGWFGFFTGSRAYLYPELRRSLELCGASGSLAVLDDFEAYLGRSGVEIEEEAIATWYEGASVPSPLPDWAERFTAQDDERWAQLRRYLASRDVKLVDRLANEPPSPLVQGLMAMLTKPNRDLN